MDRRLAQHDIQALAFLAALALTLLWADAAWAQPVVPGTGQRADKVGDDFEDVKWSYQPNAPKASYNIDEQSRYPLGVSANNRWFESALRGQPDLIERVATPPGGLAGSQGALRMRTLRSGVPQSISNDNQQDDLLLNISARLGGNLHVSRRPNFVVRVFLPPFDEWERRAGNSFAIRASIVGSRYEASKSWRGGGGMKTDTYWPGIFIHFNPRNARDKENSASLLIRANERGYDFQGPKITETGWWTFGMSFTPDGRVHFYGHAGIDDLTAKDLISSQSPYGFQAEWFSTFFFNVVNRDDGLSWSTSWIIDDPILYYDQPRAAMGRR